MLRLRSSYIISLLLSLAGLLVAIPSGAQELNCRVTIQTPTIQVTKRDLLVSLEQFIIEFMNNRRWTNLNVTPPEKIDCSLTITLNTFDQATGAMSGTFQVTAFRPVYNTSFTSTTLNYLDNSVAFEYNSGSQQIYQEGIYTTELTALLSYYAYLIIGYDADSYSAYGGDPYFAKLVSIVNGAQSGSGPGWTSGKSNDRNRFSISYELTNEQYKPAREALYLYYRAGLDHMSEDNEKGIASIMKSLETLKEMRRRFPNAALSRLFFDSHYLELIDLFAPAEGETKCTARDLLMSIDMAHANRYSDKISGCN